MDGLIIYKSNDKTYILDGKKMWEYNGEEIKEVEFKPIID